MHGPEQLIASDLALGPSHRSGTGADDLQRSLPSQALLGLTLFTPAVRRL